MKKKGILLFPMLFILSSCNENGTACPPVQAGRIIVEREGDRENLAIGETNQLSSHAYGNIKDEVSYVSLTPDVVSVSQSGLVTALKEGTGRVKISASSDDSIYSICNYTVYSTLRDHFDAIDGLLTKIESLDLSIGASFTGQIKLDLRKVKADILDDISTEILDTSYSEENDKRISLPFSIEVQKQSEVNDNTYYHLSLKLADTINTLIENNPLLKIADATVNLKSILYTSLIEKIDSSYSDYLTKDDNEDLYSIDLYNSGTADFYSALKKDYSDDSSQIQPYAFSKNNIVNLLSPHWEDISKIISSSKDDTENTDFNQFLNKDSLVFFQSLIRNYIVETKDTDSTILSLNSEAVSFLNQLYDDKFPNPIYTISIESKNVSITFPQKIENIYLNIGNTFDTATLTIQGVDQDISYPFLSLSLDSFTKETKSSFSRKRADLKGYIEASSDFDSIETSSFLKEKTNVRKLINEAQKIREAELTYSCDTENENLKKKKIQLFSYYYNDALCDEKRRYLLSVMMDRLSSLNYDSMDQIVAYADKTELNDNEKAKYCSNHFYKGEDYNDFTVSYESSDEAIIDVDQEGNVIAKSAIYNGNVKKGNVKETTKKAKVALTLSPKENGALKEQKEFEQEFTYTGEKKSFRSCSIPFAPNDKFDMENRELTLNSNEEFDLNNLFTITDNVSVRYTSLDLRLATTKFLKNNILKANSPYNEIDKSSLRQLGGIKAEFTIQEEGKTRKEEAIFYIRVNVNPNDTSTNP